MPGTKVSQVEQHNRLSHNALGRFDLGSANRISMSSNIISKRMSAILRQTFLVAFTNPDLFFFGVIMGWPNLAEMYKTLGVYDSVCNLTDDATQIVNGTVNCPARDIIFT